MRRSYLSRHLAWKHGQSQAEAREAAIFETRGDIPKRHGVYEGAMEGAYVNADEIDIPLDSDVDIEILESIADEKMPDSVDGQVPHDMDIDQNGDDTVSDNNNVATVNDTSSVNIETVNKHDRNERDDGIRDVSDDAAYNVIIISR